METKMTPAQDAGAVTRELMNAFEAFKAANDERLAEIETKGAADPVLADRVDRIDAKVAEASAALEKLTRDVVVPRYGRESEQKSAGASGWEAYLRTGETAGLSALDTKSLNVGTESDGGYVAPPELDRLIEARLQASSPMRQIASVQQTSATVFRKPVSLGAAAAWAAETGARAETTSPSLSLLSFPTAELYAMPAATQALLDDAYVDVDSWLADEVEAAFSAQESAAFVTGTGTNQPKGLLAHDTVADSAHVWGKLGYIATGVDGAFPASNKADILLDLIHAPDSRYRARGRFVMNRRVLSACRKLKDGDGRYIFRPGERGEAATLFGYPVTELEDMPDLASNQFSIAFGDFGKGYLIVDRQGARVLRDPYSSKPYVLFYTTKRVGGGVQNFDAIKLLKFGVS